MRVSTFLFILLFLIKLSFSQQITFDPLVNCGSDTSFYSNSLVNDFQSLDIHIDKRGNYHTVGYVGMDVNYNGDRPILFYKKYNKYKMPVYSRTGANSWSTASYNPNGEYLNSVTTDDTLNCFYSGQYCGKDRFVFNATITYTTGSSNSYYDFAFLAKHDSLYNLKSMLLFVPSYGNPSSSKRGDYAFTDIIYLNGKLYTILNVSNSAGSGSLKSYNFSNNTWSKILSGISPGTYLMEFTTNFQLLRNILVTPSFNTAPNMLYNGSSAYGWYNSRGASLSIDKQNRILIHYLTQNYYTGISTPITYGPYLLSASNLTKTKYPQGVSALAVFDPQFGWLNGKIIEEGKLSNHNAFVTDHASDVHGNKYVLSNNRRQTFYNNENISIINNDTLDSLGVTISKLNVNGTFIWNKYFFNCNIVDMKLSKDEKHIGVIVNSGRYYNYGYYESYTPKFSFGNSRTQLDTVITTTNEAYFLQFSNNGILEKIYQFNSLSHGQFLNIDDDGYFILNGIKKAQPPTYNLRATSIKIDGNIGQCTGPAFPGGLNDTLFIHLPKKDLCSNTSVYVPWIATSSIPTVNLGYYINTGSTKNYIATNISSQTFGYNWQIPNTIAGADSIRFFIESTDLLYSHQIGFYRFFSNKNIITWSDTTICKGAAVSIIPNNPKNLTWSPASYFADPLLDTTQNVVFNSNAQLFVKEEYNYTGCVSYDTVNIQVINNPVAAFNYTLCPTSLSLSNNSTNTDSIRWFVNGGPAINNLNDLNLDLSSPSMSICLTGSNKCFIDTSCQILNVHFSINDSLQICSGDSVYLQGAWQFNSGVYRDTLTSINNVDSIVDKTLAVRPIKIINQSISLCNNDSIYLAGNYQHSPGIYSDTLQTSFGCDSIIKTTLQFKPLYSTNKSMYICANDSVFLEGGYQTSPGLYIDSLLSISGCDSIIRTTLQINPLYLVNKSLNICPNDSVFLAGQYQHISGLYVDSLQSIQGCDSIIHTQLNISALNLSTTLNGSIITANAVGTYQWIDCNNGNSIITGQTNQSFSPIIDGSYACIINENTCLDTTACLTILGLKLNNIEKSNEILLYPNPTNGIFMIEVTETSTIEVCNLLSQKILLQELKPGKNEINLSGLPDSVYSVRIKQTQGFKNAFVIKRQ